MTRDVQGSGMPSREYVLNETQNVASPTTGPATSSRPTSSRQTQYDQRRPTEATKATILEIHGYRTGNTLGHGSYATVKEAYSQNHNMTVAIKIISKKRAPADYLEKFLPREIDIIRKLKHPNLILNIQCIETSSRVYIIMESATNGDLLTNIRTRKFIEEKLAAVWYCQLADGIVYLHSIGVVHRDLKCENLLLDRKNNLKICDFGFAREGVISSDGRFVLSETYCGSYAYAPPEILTGTPYPGHLADVWSSGVILYVMVFGSLPFEDSNHRELLRQVRRGPEFPTRTDRQQVTQLCKNLIKRILVKREMRVAMPVVRSDPWCRKYGPPLPDPSKAKSPKTTPPSSNPSSRPGTASRGQQTSEKPRRLSPAPTKDNLPEPTQKADDTSSRSRGEIRSPVDGYVTAESSVSNM